MANALSEINSMQFDGTFYTVPSQFYQLWTIFVNIDRYTIPAIHCLMTSKSRELYTAIVQRISTCLIDFKHTIAISDWEPAPRNSFKEIYPTIIIYACWFHYTQCIWRKTHKIGLVQNFREIPDLAQYIRQLMALPFLPSSIIRQTYALLKRPEFLLNESFKLNKLLKYFKKRWLNQIDSEELSTYNSDVTTNNGAESYHAKLKAIIKTAHPRIWTFVSILNHIIEDTNNELGRLQRGKVITRPRKRINILKEERRKFYKEMLQSSVYTPLQYLHSMAHTVGSFPYV